MLVKSTLADHVCKFSKALFTRDILVHNIVIKRYCDKNIFLSHGFQQNIKYLDLWYIKSLPWLVIEIHGSKISFYRNIFLSQYCVPKCLVWIRPKCNHLENAPFSLCDKKRWSSLIYYSEMFCKGKKKHIFFVFFFKNGKMQNKIMI
jgi:hypothetical protein